MQFLLVLLKLKINHMIKKLLSIACLLSSFVVSAQSFSALYDFAATTSVTGTTDPTTPPSATGLTFGSFQAVGTSSNSTAGNRFSFTNWGLGAINGQTSVTTMTGNINPNQYYEVTLTPDPNYTITVNTMTFTVQRSGTGIRSYAVRSSASNYSVNLPASVTSNTNISIVNTNEFFWVNDASTSAQNGSTITFGPTSFSTPLTLRFYAWNAEAGTGTFSIDNVRIDGSAFTPTCAVNASVTSIASNGPICSSQDLELTATAIGDGPLTYSWTGNGTFSDAAALTTTVTNASGNYTLSVSNVCGTATAVINPTVNITPTVQVTSAAICIGGSATLTATGADTYTWSTGANTDAISDNPVTETTYTVIGTSSAGCVAASFATATISIISTPTITLNSPSICAGATATLTAGGASTYTWSTNQNSATINVSPAADESYTVTASVAGCSGTFSNVANVTVNALPAVSISTLSAICAGESATLTANGAATYTWSAGSQTLTSIVVSPTTTTTYTLNGASAQGCLNSSTSTLTVNPLPILSASNQTICIGETATFTVSGAQSYTWTSPSTVGSSFTATPTSTGVTVYTVVGTSSLSCSNTRTVSVNTRALPNISANANNTVICAGESVTLFGLGGGLTTYTWTGGVTNATSFQPSTTQTYTVSSTGAFNNCVNSDVITIVVNPCTSIQEFDAKNQLSIQPNPNNGIFTLHSNFTKSVILIFDVTGKKVFEKSTSDNTTQVNLSNLESGVYYIQLTEGNKTLTKKMLITK